MTFIAFIWAAALAWALLTGKATWLRRTVTRTADPIPYWISVAIYGLMTMLFLSLGPVR